MEGTTVDWRGFLPGDCRLARQVLPYVVGVHEELAGWERSWSRLCCITGIRDYDSGMVIYAVLVFMMASSIAANDYSWLENGELIAALRVLDGWRSGDDRKMRRKQCTLVMGLIDRAGCSLRCSRDTGGRASVPVEGWTNPVVRKVREMVDECGIQMLKDVFYLVTCWTTHGDRVFPVEKWCNAEAIVLRAGEELSWATMCLTEDSLECGNGSCSHWTGVVPVVKSVEEDEEGKDDLEWKVDSFEYACMFV